MAKLYCHVEKHVDIAPEVMTQVCLELLTEITVAFSESQCETLSLNDLKLMTVRQVAESSRDDAMRGSICPAPLQDDQTQSQLSLAVECEKLLTQLVVLVGRLTGCPRHGKPTEQVGALYFEDGTAAVVCEVRLCWSYCMIIKITK